MSRTLSRTYALMEVSDATYEEVQEKLLEAGYDTDSLEGDGALDMHGIALVRGGDPLTLRHLRSLKVQAGDCLVLHCDAMLSRAAVERIHEMFAAHFGDTKVLVLEKGLELGVLRGATKPGPGADA